MKYAYVDLYRCQYSVVTLYRVLEVGRASYYASKSGTPSLHTSEDLALRLEIVRVHAEHRWMPGAVKMWRLLNAKGVSCGKHRVARLRRVEGIKTNRTRRFQRKQAMDRSEPPAPDLVKRAFRVPMPNLVWVGDMTVIRTKEGWLHLAIVLDLFSRKIVGWATDAIPVVALPTKALTMAIAARRPGTGLIFHSDQGSAYSSCSYRQLLEQNGLRASMSRKGNCHDNAVAESFFSNLKNEVLHHRQFPTRAEAEAVVNDYIGVYDNEMRLHQTLQYRTPATVEVQFKALN